MRAISALLRFFVFVFNLLLSLGFTADDVRAFLPCLDNERMSNSRCPASVRRRTTAVQGAPGARGGRFGKALPAAIAEGD